MVPESDIQQLIISLKQEKSYKTDFLVTMKGNKMVHLLTKEIVIFYISNLLYNISPLNLSVLIIKPERRRILLSKQSETIVFNN
jgi:hypothetical protein